MRTSVLVAGIVILIVGGIIAGVGHATLGILLGGIVVLIVGIIIAGIGAALRPRSGVRTVSGGMSASSHSMPASSAQSSQAGTDAMSSMVEMLAKAPEEQRRTMIKSKLSSFAQQQETDRAAGMKAMLLAIHKLDSDSVKRLTLTRMESLAEDFDPETRRKLMATHMSVLMSLPAENMNAEMKAIFSVMGQCHEGCRMKDMSTMKEIMMSMPEEKRAMMMKAMPPEVSKMMM